MVLNNIQEMELKNGVSRMVMEFNANDKVGNILTSLDSAQIFDIIYDDIEKMNHIPTSTEVGTIMTNVLSEYVSQKFGYTDKVLKTEDVLESPLFLKDMTDAVISANNGIPNKVDTNAYCARLKSTIYGWYPEEVSIIDLMREASNLWIEMAAEVNPQL